MGVIFNYDLFNGTFMAITESGMYVFVGNNIYGQML